MKKVNAIGKRIEKLKQRKMNLEHMQARMLVKEIKNLVGKSYSPELALTIFKDTWQNESDQQKEVWHRQAEFFRSCQADQTHSNTKCYPLSDPKSYSTANDSYE